MAEQAQGAGAGDWRATIDGLRGAYAERTVNETLTEFGRFERWCGAEGWCAVPASPEGVAAYVDHRFERTAASTVRTNLIVIRRVHVALGVEDPTATRLVQLALRRGRLAKGSAVRQAAGLNAPLRDRLLAVCPPDALGLRDQVMISVGYDLLARRSELVGVRIEDLRPQADGTAYVLLRRPKSDLDGLPRPAYMSARSWDLVSAWLALIGAAEGPLLRPIQHGRVVPRSISSQTVGFRLRVLARQAGFNPAFVARLSSHSLRVGAAQDLASSGRTLLEIMLAGRWRDLSSVADYTRDAQVNVWAPGDGDTYAHVTGVEGRVRRHERVEGASVLRRPRTAR